VKINLKETEVEDTNRSSGKSSKHFFGRTVFSSPINLQGAEKGFRAQVPLQAAKFLQRKIDLQ
jgi:hypothetical protein